MVNCFNMNNETRPNYILIIIGKVNIDKVTLMTSSSKKIMFF